MLSVITLKARFNYGAPIMTVLDKKVTRQSVLDLIKRIPMALTTKEMARVLMCKEVSVRAAIIWLEIGGFIREQGKITRKYENKSYTKKVSLWRWTGKIDEICKVCIKETDQADRERNSKNYGDGVLLQHILMGMRK